MYGINYQRTQERVHATSVDMLNNRIDKYLVKAEYT